jgi:hypothetical protein
MNLDDLRGELRTRSQEADRSDPDLFPGVQHKIRTIRRRRTGIIVGTAVAAVALVLSAPGLFDHDGSRPSDPVDRPTPGVIVSPPSGDVSAAGITYRKTYGGRTLLAAVIGQPGEDSITLRWKVSTTNIVLYEYCADPGAPQLRDTPNELPWVALSRERGPLIMTGPCTPPTEDAARLPVDSYGRGVANLEQRRAITVGSTLALTYSFKKSPEPGGMEPSSRVRDTNSRSSRRSTAPSTASPTYAARQFARAPRSASRRRPIADSCSDWAATTSATEFVSEWRVSIQRAPATPGSTRTAPSQPPALSSALSPARSVHARPASRQPESSPHQPLEAPCSSPSTNRSDDTP